MRVAIAPVIWHLLAMSPMIRPATLADAPALTACITRAYAKAAARLPDLPDVAAGLAGDIADHSVWVAESEGGILGGAVLVEAEGRAVLANLAVDPAAQGMGLARHLIAAVEGACRARRYDALHLSTHADMPENLSLYTYLGWQVAGQSGNKVRMIKTLGPQDGRVS